MNTIENIKKFISDLTGNDVSELDKETTIFELGIDSVMMVNFVMELNERFGVEFTLNDIVFSYNTLETLGKEVDNRQQEKSVEINYKKDVDRECSIYCEPEVMSTQLKNSNLLDKQTLNNSALTTILDIVRSQEQTMERVFKLHMDMIKYAGAESGLESIDANKIDDSRINCTTEKKHKENTKIEEGGDVELSENTSDIVLTSCQMEMVQGLIQVMNEKMKESKSVVDYERKELADLDESAGFSKLLKELHYTPVIDYASGSKFTDIDGNEYIDIAMGFGALLLGHSNERQQNVLKKEIDRGFQMGARHRLVGKTAQLICDMTGFDRAVFTVTGTEAVMCAKKIARTYTHRPKIAIFTGCYHGHYDSTLATKLSFSNKIVPIAPGISEASLMDIMILDYGDMKACDEIREHKSELAAVLIEPVQSRRPGAVYKEFLQKLREVTKENGILLILDEVITGFRCNNGGANVLLGIDADMCIYGKAISAGMPIGVVCGRKEIMDHADGGFWQFGDNSYPSVEKTFFAGTFFKHALSITSAYEVLNILKENNNRIQDELNDKTEQLANNLNSIFGNFNVPIEVHHFASLFFFSAQDNNPYMDIFFYKLLEYGIYVWSGRTCFLSTAHSDDDIRKILEIVEKVVKDMVNGGFWKKNKDNVINGMKKGIPSIVFEK